MTAPTLGPTRDEVLARTVEEGDCLIWQGARDGGRPVLEVPDVDGRRRRVSVRLWLAVLAGDAKALADEAVRGRGRMRGFWVARCGVPGCVNPEHARRVDKAAHMAAAGRAMWAHDGTRAVAAPKIARSCRERRGVLSAEQVAGLPALVGELGTQKAAARALGVSQQAVSVLLRRQQGQALRPGGVWGGLVR